MRFRPCIDLHNGKVKQIVGSSLGGESLVENFISNKAPSWYAKRFREDGLTGGHVIMLGTGNENAAMEALSAWSNGLQIGGGINPHNAEKYLNAGASHVIVTSYVFNDGELDFAHLKEISNVVGKKRLVVDLSCAKKEGRYFVKTDRWTKWSDFEVCGDNIAILSEFCVELLVHAVSVEGLQGGIDEELVQLLGKIADCPITYAGGIRDFNDINLIHLLSEGKLDFTVGSALDIYGGDLSYDELIRFLSNNFEGR